LASSRSSLVRFGVGAAVGEVLLLPITLLLLLLLLLFFGRALTKIGGTVHLAYPFISIERSFWNADV
jgi:hypothetical protein